MPPHTVSERTTRPHIPECTTTDESIIILIYFRSGLFGFYLTNWAPLTINNEYTKLYSLVTFLHQFQITYRSKRKPKCVRWLLQQVARFNRTTQATIPMGSNFSFLRCNTILFFSFNFLFKCDKRTNFKCLLLLLLLLMHTTTLYKYFTFNSSISN